MPTDNRARLKQRLYLAAGIFFVALGALGMFLPVLPTTPLLILAAAMFMRSSDRLHRWLMGHDIFGPFIRNYRLYRAIPRRTKIDSLAFLWLTIGYSVIFAVDSIWIRILLLLVAIGVSWHLVKLKTLTPAMQEEIDRREAALANQPKIPESSPYPSEVQLC